MGILHGGHLQSGVLDTTAWVTGWDYTGYWTGLHGILDTIRVTGHDCMGYWLLDGTRGKVSMIVSMMPS